MPATSTPVTAAQVDVLVNKTDSVDPVALGQTTTYTVTTTNVGPSFANNVVLVDTFPTGSPTATFSYQGSLTIAPPGIGTCIEPSVGVTSGTINCTFPGLNNGQSAAITYVMRAETIASGVSGTSFNTSTVTADEPETQLGNNTVTESTTSRRTADLSVVKTASGTVIPGTTLSYTITVTNNGPNASTGAILTDTLAASVVFQSASPGCVRSGQTVTCTLGTLANAASTVLTITVLVPSPFTGTSPISNAASVGTVTEVDPASGNNTGLNVTTVGGSIADLALVKSALPTSNPGNLLTYTLTVTNNGPSQSVGAIVSDTLTAGVSFVSASTGCAIASDTVTCTLGTLANGASTTLAITVRINAPYTASNPLTNSANVTTTNESDPSPANDSGSVTTLVADITPVPTLGGTMLGVLALAIAFMARRRLGRS